MNLQGPPILFQHHDIVRLRGPQAAKSAIFASCVDGRYARVCDADYFADPVATLVHRVAGHWVMKEDALFLPGPWGCTPATQALSL